MTHAQHGIIYDCKRDSDDRFAYLCKYMALKMLGDRLPTSAVVEEFIEARKYSGDVSADHGVCGFMLGGKFFPISINLCGTENGICLYQVRLLVVL